MNLEQSLKLAREDNTAFREIYDSTINRVYSFVLLRVRNKELALDICQDTYLSFWKSLPRFEYMSDSQFYAFLFKVARRQLIRARMKMRETVELDEAYDIPIEGEEREDYRVLLSKVQNLKESERLCVELRYFKDLKFQDIAEILGVSENNAKVIHHRAIKKLKEDLQIYE
ncbi:MAG: sigma-70 family RNA polymerase sigma factor [bacterium]|nr:sigma-70 family RNA polymerase sigma factor [bacterium]